MYRLLQSFLVVLFAASCAMAQPTITTGLNVNQYIQQFAGAGVTIIPNSATITGHPNQIGIFDFANNTPNVGVSQGIVMSTGSVNFVEQFIPNINSFFPSTEADSSIGNPGHPSLDILAANNTNDAVVLTFQFVPSSDTARFEYMFASDEYEEFAPPISTGFNDVFGFFISGPGIVGEENIALIPGTTTPVSINNINPITNQQFYNSNDPGQGTVQQPNFTYDGYSDIFVAEREVIPCDTYTLSLRLADAFDDFFDTAVFLVANSFGSNVSISTNSPFTSPGGNFVVYEGTNASGPIGFTLFRDPNNTPQDTIEVIWGGSADLGTDYLVGVPKPDSIVFPAGQDELFIEITALSDNLVEGPDTILFVIPLGAAAGCGGQANLTSTLIILDCPPMSSSALDTVAACNGAAVDLESQVTGGVAPLQYAWPQLGLSTADVNFTPTSDSLIEFKVWDVCNDTLREQIFVELLQANAPLSISTSPNVTICAGAPTTLEVFPIDGTGSYSYNWNGFGSQPSLQVAPNNSQSYSVTVDDGCTQETATIAVDVLPAMTTTVVSGTITICDGAQATFQVSASSGSGSYTYDWRESGNGQIIGTGPSITVAPAVTTSYNVTVSDGCSLPVVHTVVALVADPVELSVSADPTICEGDATTLTATGSGGFGNYEFTWTTPGNPPQASSSITVSPTATTTYTIEMTETTCQLTPLTETVVVNVINTPSVDFTLDPNPLCEGAPIDVEFTGNIPNTGTPTFNWDFGSANVQSGSGQGPYVISFDDAGTYDLSLEVNMDQNGVTCPIVSRTRQMVIAPQPVADFEVPAPQCLAGNAYSFEATGTRDNVISYTWTFPDAQPGTKSGMDVNRIRFESEGVKSVTLALSAAAGLCTDEITKPVTVWRNPDAPEMQGDSLCPGFEATLLVVQPIAGEAYIWSGGAGSRGFIGTTLVTPRLNVTQNYEVFSRDANGCESLTRTPVQAYVHPQPELEINFSPDQIETPNAIVTFSYTSSVPMIAWNWEFSDRNTSQESNPVHQYVEPGPKSVALTAVDINACVATVINDELVVEETPAAGLPTAFSPNGDGLNDRYTADLSHMTEVSFRVYSRLGELVFEANTPTFEWDGSAANGIELPEGVYPFIMEYTLYNGVSDTETGTITLLR